MPVHVDTDFADAITVEVSCDRNGVFGSEVMNVRSVDFTADLPTRVSQMVAVPNRRREQMLGDLRILRYPWLAAVDNRQVPCPGLCRITAIDRYGVI